MAIDPSIAARFDAAARQWDEDDEAERAAKFADEPADPPADEPDADADDMPVEASPEQFDVISGDMPNVAPEEHPMVLPEMDLTEPPRARPPVPATAGAGQKGMAAPRSAAEPAASLDWKGLADRLGWGTIGRNTSRSLESMLANVGARTGYRPNAHAGDVLVESAQQPLAMAKEKQAFEGHELAQKQQRAAFAAKEAMDDPNSLQSQKAREAVRAMGLEGLPAGFDNFSANDIQHFVKTGELRQLNDAKARNAAAEVKTQQAEAERQRKIALHEKERGEDLKHRREMEKIGWAAAARGDRAADRADNPKLPPGQLADVADYDTAAKAADELLASYEQAGLDGMLSRAAGAISDVTGADLGDVSQYNDKANTAAQTIGLALEGGKLGEADLPRYRNMLPKAGDSIERARAKRDNLKRALADKAAGRSIEWLKAGYKVPGGGDSGDHGAVVKETKSFRRYADGYVEEK